MLWYTIQSLYVNHYFYYYKVLPLYPSQNHCIHSVAISTAYEINCIHSRVYKIWSVNEGKRPVRYKMIQRQQISFAPATPSANVDLGRKQKRHKLHILPLQNATLRTRLTCSSTSATKCVIMNYLLFIAIETTHLQVYIEAMYSTLRPW